MSDEENKEGGEDKKPEGAEANFRERNKQERLDLIKSENETIERMEKANKDREELLDREEALMDAKQLSGDSDAGKPSEGKKETPKEYAEKVMKGE